MYKILYFLLLSTAFILTSTQVYSTELHEALHLALENSFKIKSQFYSSYGNKKQIIANGVSGFLPTISLNLQSKESNNILLNNSNGITGIGKVGGAVQFTISQSLFDGGADIAAFQKSKYLTKVENLNFLANKNKLIIEAIESYMKVLTAIEVHKLSQNNEKLLKEHLLVAKKRFAVGEITKTDISQATARLSLSTSESIKAQGEVRAAKAYYEHIIGIKPENLKYPSKLPSIPKSLKEIIDLARKNNLYLQLANYSYKASKQDIIAAIAKSLPSVNVSASISKNNYMIPKDDQSLILNVSIPIFQKGIDLANIERSNMIAKQKKYDFYEAAKSLEESVIVSWEKLSTVQSMLKSSKESVKAAEMALEGVKQEAKLNLRTTLDVLDSEQELFKTKVNLVNAQNSEIISIYSLLALIGSLNIN